MRLVWGESMNLMETMRHDASGVAIITDWLGDEGVPVHPVVAERRSKACLSCPLNTAPNWWEKVKDKIAEAIKTRLSLKKGMMLEVEKEDELNMCKICGCCNRLSVWTPIIHIAHHTEPEQLEKYPDFCWKKTEIKEHLK